VNETRPISFVVKEPQPAPPPKLERLVLKCIPEECVTSWRNVTPSDILAAIEQNAELREAVSKHALPATWEERARTIGELAESRAERDRLRERVAELENDIVGLEEIATWSTKQIEEQCHLRMAAHVASCELTDKLRAELTAARAVVEAARDYKASYQGDELAHGLADTRAELFAAINALDSQPQPSPIVGFSAANAVVDKQGRVSEIPGMVIDQQPETKPMQKDAGGEDLSEPPEGWQPSKELVERMNAQPALDTDALGGATEAARGEAWLASKVAKPEPQCEWYDDSTDDEPDSRVLTSEPCDKPATHVSCVPNVRTLTCAEHKCRCAKPIAKPEPTAAAIQFKPGTEVFCLGFYGDDGCGWSGRARDLHTEAGSTKGTCPVCKGGHIKERYEVHIPRSAVLAALEALKNTSGTNTMGPHWAIGRAAAILEQALEVKT